MSLKLKLLKLHIPGFIQTKEFIRLFQRTADVFGGDVPNIKKMRLQQIREQFARYTAQAADSLVCSRADTKDVQRRLYDAAFQLGAGLKERFKIKKRKDALALLPVIYRILGIDLKIDDKKFIVKNCFFSRYYSEEICRIISALDMGLLAGLTSGGRLEFTQRITGGRPCCVAEISFEEVRR